MGSHGGDFLEAKIKRSVLREGDRNTGFFHKMANSHIRKNCLSKIKVNGTWLTEEQEIKGKGWLEPLRIF